MYHTTAERAHRVIGNDKAPAALRGLWRGVALVYLGGRKRKTEQPTAESKRGGIAVSILDNILLFYMARAHGGALLDLSELDGTLISW